MRSERRQEIGQTKYAVNQIDYIKFLHVIHGAEARRRQAGRETKAEDGCRKKEDISRKL